MGLAAITVFAVSRPVYGRPNSDLRQTVTTLVSNERIASEHRTPFSYLSIEKSDRTGGHLWTERVAEVREGKLRLLLSEDGKPISQDRRKKEIGKLREIASDPSSFMHREQVRKRDEEHAMQMFNLLPHAFLFQNDGWDGQWLRIKFQPDPAYVPQSYEERVLHGMAGYMLIDPQASRLHYLEGHLAEDVSFGYGLLATIHQGSSFSITRAQVVPAVWKTTLAETHIDGHVFFFKTVSHQMDFEHQDFQPLPANLPISQAVDLLIREH